MNRRLALVGLAYVAVECVLLLLAVAAIGPLRTVAIVALTALTGVWLVQREGLGTLRKLRQDSLTGTPDPETLAETAVVLLAGILLLLPGLLSDMAAMILLLSNTARRAATRRVQGFVASQAAKSGVNLSWGTPQARPSGEKTPSRASSSPPFHHPVR